MFFPFSDGAILSHLATRTIWYLNHTAAVIWCLLEQTDSLDELVEEFSQRFAIDQLTAERDIKLSLAHLGREGLLQPAADPAPAVSRQEETAATLTRGPEVTAPARWGLRQSFGLGGSIIEFCCQDAVLGRAFTDMLRHLQGKGELTPDARLWVLPSKDSYDGWDVCLDGRRCFAALPADEVMPALLTVAFYAASQALHDWLLLHAAVLKKGGTALLLPAAAGCGKTTLAAALAARGWVFYSDELAIVDLRNLRVSPLPLPMSIKAGSIAALAPLYPDLATRPEHRRVDGQLVRYLLPPKASLPEPGESAPVGRIIFPKFNPGVSGCQAARLSSLDALRMLTATGSSDRELTASDVRALIALVEEGLCLALTFSDLTQVLELIEHLAAAREQYDTDG